MTQQQQVGKYQLVRKLAAGGMAEVFLAKAAGPMGFEKTLVVKRILPELAEEPDFVGMFLSEARLAARLTHPNIVQIFDFGESEGTYFLAMEYIDGPSLRMLIKRAAAQGMSLPPTLCARIISQACEGLAFAHDFADPDTGEPLGLIHRDISPDNILLSRQGAVKVVDFGIAKAAGQSHKTESGVIKGKIPYMPPEQLRAKALDSRTDVYALGVVLYELLTGQRPYVSESEAGLMQAILFEPPVPAARIRPDLPQPLRRILSKVLSKEREQRYPDCHAFQADLEAFIVSTGRPVTTQQVAQLINQATSSPGMPALTPAPLTPSRPATPPPSEPSFLDRKRPSSSTNEALTTNHRGPQVPKEEAPGALVTPPPRRPSSELMTAQVRPPRPSRPIALPSTEPESAPRSSARWGIPLLGLLLLVAGSGVVVSRMKGQPEVQKPALATESPPPQAAEESVQRAEAPAEPPEPLPSPLPDAGKPDAGVPDEGNAVAARAVSNSGFKGTLEVRVWPYAIVFVDGKKRGHSPLAPLQLPAGVHTLKFVNETVPRTVLREVNVKAGQLTTLKINMLED